MNTIEQIEKIYDNYCKVRKLTKAQGELQTWGKEPMIEFAEQAILQLNEANVIKSVYTISDNQEATNSIKPVLGEVYVFELKDGKMKQISIGFENIDDANSFIETMKEGMYYKSIRPDCVLIAMQVLNFA